MLLSSETHPRHASVGSQQNNRSNPSSCNLQLGTTPSSNMPYLSENIGMQQVVSNKMENTSNALLCSSKYCLDELCCLLEVSGQSLEELECYSIYK